jgi:hypothetical protein
MFLVAASLHLVACGKDDPTINPYAAYGSGACHRLVKYICTCHGDRSSKCRRMQRRVKGKAKEMAGQCEIALERQKIDDAAKGIRCL